MRDRGIFTRIPTSPDEFNAGLSAALREADVSAKAVAQIVEKSPRHTEKWIDGTRSPTFFDGLAMARHIPAVQKWIAYLIGLETDVLKHNEWQAELARFERALAAMKGGDGK